MWVYWRSGPNLYTVGFYAPDGECHTDSDWDEREDAADRVHYLNGGNKKDPPKAVQDWDMILEIIAEKLE